MSEKYYRQNESLKLPIFVSDSIFLITYIEVFSWQELFYFFNIFSHTGGRPELLDPILARIQVEIGKLKEDDDEIPKDIDNYALMLLLKGVSLRCKKQNQAAAECFSEVIKLYVSIFYLTLSNS